MKDKKNKYFLPPKAYWKESFNTILEDSSDLLLEEIQKDGFYLLKQDYNLDDQGVAKFLAAKKRHIQQKLMHRLTPSDSDKINL